MKRWKKAAAVAAAAATIGVGISTAPVSSAEDTPMGYTVVGGDGACELATVDLTTGALTDLPAGPSADACVTDLAVGADGVVHGILPPEEVLDDIGDGLGDELVPLAVDAASFVTFDASGAPTATAITVEDATASFLAFGGIAIAANGTVYLHMVTDEPGCDADAVCLYTYDSNTGVATLVGSTGLVETFFGFLTSCSSAMRTIADTGPIHGSLATENPATGAVTPTVEPDANLVGADCQSTGDTLYALAAPDVDDPGDELVPLAVDVAVGTVDPATGAFTETAPLSDPGADVRALAVAPGATPTTTTTSQPAAAQPADVVRPSFTG